MMDPILPILSYCGIHYFGHIMEVHEALGASKNEEPLIWTQILGSLPLRLKMDPTSLHNMVFGPRSLKMWVLTALAQHETPNS